CNREQRDLGRGVKTETKQKADWEHLPAARNHPEQRPEHARQQTAAGEQMIELMLGNRFAAARALKAAPHLAQNELDKSNSQQEKYRRAGADYAADHLERMKLALEREGHTDNHRDRDGDDERMAEREKQSGRDRPFAFLHQLAHDIVDCRDMIGIDGMAKPEHIGEERGAEKCRMG